jgi:hypothetical protein
MKTGIDPPIIFSGFDNLPTRVRKRTPGRSSAFFHEGLQREKIGI